MKPADIQWSAAALLLLACGGSSTPGQATPANFPQGEAQPAGPEAREHAPRATPKSEAPADAIEVIPDELCEATGASMEVRGKLERQDLGHRVEGLFLQTADKRWVLSYGIPEDLTPLVGATVVVTGTPCVRNGRAIVGPHLNPTRVQRAE